MAELAQIRSGTDAIVLERQDRSVPSALLARGPDVVLLLAGLALAASYLASWRVVAAEGYSHGVTHVPPFSGQDFLGVGDAFLLLGALVAATSAWALVAPSARKTAFSTALCMACVVGALFVLHATPHDFYYQGAVDLFGWLDQQGLWLALFASGTGVLGGAWALAARDAAQVAAPGHRGRAPVDVVLLDAALILSCFGGWVATHFANPPLIGSGGPIVAVPNPWMTLSGVSVLQTGRLVIVLAAAGLAAVGIGARRPLRAPSVAFGISVAILVVLGSSTVHFRLPELLGLSWSIRPDLWFSLALAVLAALATARWSWRVQREVAVPAPAPGRPHVP